MGTFVGTGLIIGVALDAAFDIIAVGTVIGLIFEAAIGGVFSRITLHANA